MAFRCAAISANSSSCLRCAASTSASAAAISASASLRASACISETSSTARFSIFAIRRCIACGEGEVSVRTATSLRSAAVSSPAAFSRVLRLSTSSSSNCCLVVNISMWASTAAGS